MLNKSSLPSWERGLKFFIQATQRPGLKVAPFVGAWIEILGERLAKSVVSGRSLRGSVD